MEACVLVEHTQLGTDETGYVQMLRALCTEKNLASLVGRIFTSGLQPETEYEMVIYSGANEVGRLSPDTPCEHWGEPYGHPA